MSKRYGIGSIEEAIAYIEHDRLRQRLIECTKLVLKLADHPIGAILPPPDDLKFQSCMTLLSQTSDESFIFQLAIDAFFQGEAASQTLALIQGSDRSRS